MTANKKPLSKYKRELALRKALVGEFGKGNYRMTFEGEVLVRGIIPNTSREGWYCAGYVSDFYKKYGL